MRALRIYPRKGPRVLNESALTTPTRTKTAPLTCVGLVRAMISKGGLADRVVCTLKKRVRRRVYREPLLMGGGAKIEAEACRDKRRDLLMLTGHLRENLCLRGALGARLIDTVAHKAESTILMRGIIGGGQEQHRKTGG